MEAIAIYRVSSKKQADLAKKAKQAQTVTDEGNRGNVGLDEQKRVVADIARNIGATIIDHVEVIAVSGNQVFESAEWQQQVSPRLNGRYVLIFYDFDRVCRADNFDLRCLMEVYNSKTQVYTPAGKYNFDRPEDVMMVTIFAAVSGLEKQKIRKRTMGGKRTARTLGWWADGRTPKGIRWDRETRTFTLTEEAPIVASAFQEYAAGTTTQAEIGRRLGVSTKYAGDLLQNRLYLGQTEPGKPYLEPIVDEATFVTCGQRIKMRAKSRASVNVVTKAKCAYTAMLVQAITPSPVGWVTFPLEQSNHVLYGSTVNGHRYYRCRCALDKTMGKCSAGNLRAADVDAVIDAYLAAMTSDPLFQSAAERALVAPDTSAEQRKALQAVIAECNESEARLVKMYTKGRIKEEVFEAEQDAIVAERKKAEARLAGLADGPKVTAGDLAALVASWQFPATGTGEDKRAWAKRFVHAIKVNAVGRSIEVAQVVIRVPLQTGGYAHYGHGADGESAVGVVALPSEAA